MPDSERVTICFIKDNFILRKKKFSKTEQDSLHSLVVKEVAVQREEVFRRRELLSQMGYPVSQALQDSCVSLKKQEKQEKQDRQDKQDRDDKEDKPAPLLTHQKEQEEEWQLEVAPKEDDDEELDLDFDEHDFEEEEEEEEGV